MNLDLSFANATRVIPKDFNKLRVFLIGAGGTGSFAAMGLARVLFELKRIGKLVELTIIDPDLVENSNIPRSNFCLAELGKPKAQMLANRITLAWGLETAFAAEELEFGKQIKPFQDGFKELTVLIGCVDNHLARREIQRTLREMNRYSKENAPGCWWIDGGNGRFSGQVLIGSELLKDTPKNYFSTSTICRKLPAPSIVHPELLENQDLRKPREFAERISCAERIRRSEQSLNINQRVAVEINEILAQFLLTNSLRRFAVYFDLESGTSRSSYCTPQIIAETLQSKKKGK